MRTLIMHPLLRINKTHYYWVTGILLLILAYQLAPLFAGFFNNTTAVLDAAVWQLLLFSILTFMALLTISWFLLYASWSTLGLPNIHFMVLQFKDLSSWKQLSFYYACFALLFLGAVACVAAIF
ncbi:hypothetical protein [Pedobacter sp. BMA]|uniref:hypothetical protein n=1 Tax=Pedobacter sp. BMA TaxID=1663685 RepID=UPI0012E0A04E|nr:hypothetical protein [Pedobacter sp. BMA]